MAGLPPRVSHQLRWPVASSSCPEIERLAGQVGASSRLEIVAVQIFTHRIPMTVEVRVRRADGADVTLEECAAFSGSLGEAIEASELLPSAYVLEISSPGIGEDLITDRDFESFRGFPVEVMSSDSPGSPSPREGLLLGRDDQSVLINLRGRSVRIPRSEVVRVRLVGSHSDP
jgi:ribosome maturation factor RimP